tara:strand:+ start:421 stop:627 length:207 start_codon:yes stop_codon:yes gene_type:complete
VCPQSFALPVKIRLPGKKNPLIGLFALYAANRLILASGPLKVLVFQENTQRKILMKQKKRVISPLLNL